MINEQERLVEKSIEAFIMGIEIYNKPTIKYRIEGFSFFIVNAWELMLKAELLKREENIFFMMILSEAYQLVMQFREYIQISIPELDLT